MLNGVKFFANPTLTTNPIVFKNMMSTTSPDYFDPEPTCYPTCRGGSAYAARSYPVRVIKEFVKTGKDSESLLAKRGGLTDINFVRIRDQEGGTFTKMNDYIDAYVDHSKAGVAMPWECVEVCVDDTWVPGNQFYSLSQPSTENTNLPPMPEPTPTSFGGFNTSDYKKLRYKVRISPKSENERWYTNASKEGLMMMAPHTELYRCEVKSGGKYYSTLWGWLKSDPLLPVHEGILYAQSDVGDGDPWNHIEVLVGDGWVDGIIFCVFRQNIMC